MAKTKEKSGASGGVENDKLCAALSYVLIGIIWYFADEKMKKSALAKWHAKNGLALLLASVAVNIALSIVAWIPVINMVAWILGMIVWICFLILWVMGILGALSGKQSELPVISDFARKFDF